jgi:hypothetical protein
VAEQYEVLQVVLRDVVDDGLRALSMSDALVDSVAVAGDGGGMDLMSAFAQRVGDGSPQIASVPRAMYQNESHDLSSVVLLEVSSFAFGLCWCLSETRSWMREYAGSCHGWSSMTSPFDH